MNTVSLPCYGIVITYGALRSTATISSELKSFAKDELSAATDVIESMVLALFCSGIDVTAPAVIEAITSSVDAIINQACSSAEPMNDEAEYVEIYKHRRVSGIVNDDVTYQVLESDWSKALEEHGNSRQALEQLSQDGLASVIDYNAELIECLEEHECTLEID